MLISLLKNSKVTFIHWLVFSYYLVTVSCLEGERVGVSRSGTVKKVADTSEGVLRLRRNSIRPLWQNRILMYVKKCPWTVHPDTVMIYYLGGTDVSSQIRADPLL